MDGSASLRDLRLPRILTGALIGAMLALSRAILQAMTRNALADPALIGISQGVVLAVIVGMMAFPALSPSLRPVLALGGGAAVAFNI